MLKYIKHEGRTDGAVAAVVDCDSSKSRYIATLNELDWERYNHLIQLLWVT